MIIKLRTFLLFFFVFFLGTGFSTNFVWNQKANFGGMARHRGSAFAIGNKGYMGLGHINAVNNILFDDFWEYEPSSNTWTQKANFGGGLRYHTSSFTIGNKAYVGMGRDPFNVFYTDLWEYDPVFNSWSQKANLPGLPRRGAVGFSINNKGYIGTGETKISPYRTNDMWEYDPSNNTWVQKASMPTQGRFSAVAFSLNGLGYVGTGWGAANPNTGATNDLWEFNPLLNTWTQKTNVGPTRRIQATAFTLNGKGYIGTGQDYAAGTDFKDMWEFDPNLNTCTQIIDFAGTKRRYLLSFSIGNKAYAGIGTNGTNFNDFWEMSEVIVNVDAIKKKNFSVNIFPNPCKTISHVTIDTDSDNQNLSYSFKVFNISGKKVYEISTSSSSFEFNRNQLKNGIYLYQVSTENKIIANGKIIFS